MLSVDSSSYFNSAPVLYYQEMVPLQLDEGEKCLLALIITKIFFMVILLPLTLIAYATFGSEAMNGWVMGAEEGRKIDLDDEVRESLHTRNKENDLILPIPPIKALSEKEISEAKIDRLKDAIRILVDGRCEINIEQLSRYEPFLEAKMEAFILEIQADISNMRREVEVLERGDQKLEARISRLRNLKVPEEQIIAERERSESCQRASLLSLENKIGLLESRIVEAREALSLTNI